MMMAWVFVAVMAGENHTHVRKGKGKCPDGGDGPDCIYVPWRS